MEKKPKQSAKNLFRDAALDAAMAVSQVSTVAEAVALIRHAYAPLLAIMDALVRSRRRAVEGNKMLLKNQAAFHETINRQGREIKLLRDYIKLRGLQKKISETAIGRLARGEIFQHWSVRAALGVMEYLGISGSHPDTTSSVQHELAALIRYAHNEDEERRRGVTEAEDLINAKAGIKTEPANWMKAAALEIGHIPIVDTHVYHRMAAAVILKWWKREQIRPVEDMSDVIQKYKAAQEFGNAEVKNNPLPKVDQREVDATEKMDVMDEVEAGETTPRNPNIRLAHLHNKVGPIPGGYIRKGVQVSRPFRGVTFATMRDDYEGVIHVGVAYCSPSDSFSPQKGAMIAINRVEFQKRLHDKDPNRAYWGRAGHRFTLCIVPECNDQFHVERDWQRAVVSMLPSFLITPSDGELDLQEAVTRLAARTVEEIVEATRTGKVLDLSRLKHRLMHHSTGRSSVDRPNTSEVERKQ